MAKRKLPWMKWHPRDWLSEPTLRKSSPAARGIWMDLLMYMEADGTDRLSCTLLDYASMCGVDYDTACELITELIAKGVCDSDFDPSKGHVTARNDAITLVSRRLEREHKSRDSNRKRQERFRKRRESNGGCNGGDLDSESDSEEEQPHVAASPPPYGDIEEAWNNVAAAAGCVRCKDLTDPRRAKIRTRWRSKTWRDSWLQAINELPERAFACGENDRGWRMDFDFFLKPGTVTAILEGKYGGRPAPPKPPQRPEDKIL